MLTRISDDELLLHRARRLAAIEPFFVIEVYTKAYAMQAAGIDVIHMEVGEPDFSTPEPMIDAAVASLRRGETKYTQTFGIPPLRQAISDWYASRYGVTVPPERIAVTAGASAAFVLAFCALLNPGDEVLMPDPCYPCNKNFVRAFDGVARAIPSGPAQAYQLDAESVAKHWGSHTRGVLIASPSNPTGTIIPAEELERIVDAVKERNGFLIVDEIYHGLTYGFDVPTALALSQDVFVINSFSKYFNMTGWRLGWMVIPEAYVRDIEKLSQHLFIAPSTPAQYAALAAFDPAVRTLLEARRYAFHTRRDYLYRELLRLGFNIAIKPEGAFYLYADCSAFTDDSQRFAMELLEQTGVAVTPVRDFGEHSPKQHIRFAYTTSQARLEEAIRRIEGFLASRNPRSTSAATHSTSA